MKKIILLVLIGLLVVSTAFAMKEPSVCIGCEGNEMKEKENPTDSEACDPEIMDCSQKEKGMPHFCNLLYDELREPGVYGSSKGDTEFVGYLDFNKDGTIDLVDFGRFSTNSHDNNWCKDINKPVPTPNATQSSNSSISEPYREMKDGFIETSRGKRCFMYEDENYCYKLKKFKEYGVFILYKKTINGEEWLGATGILQGTTRYFENFKVFWKSRNTFEIEVI